ncbi:MAG: hypothetical protein WCD66_13120, partial [Rhodanobacteraceae bacterium]
MFARRSVFAIPRERCLVGKNLVRKGREERKEKPARCSSLALHRFQTTQAPESGASRAAGADGVWKRMLGPEVSRSGTLGEAHAQ